MIRRAAVWGLQVAAIVCLVPLILTILAIMGGGRPTAELLLAVPVGILLFAALSKAAQAVEPAAEVDGR